MLNLVELFGYAGMMMVTSFLLIMIDSLSNNSVNTGNWINIGILIIYALFYFVSLRWNDRYLSGRWESIQKAVAQ